MPIRLGIVGLGYMGRMHLKKLSEIEGVEIAALCDLREEIYEEFSLFRCFTDPSKLCDFCDAVIISTPATTHYALSTIFLEARKHVFIEKPLSTTVEEARKLIEVAKKANVVLKVGHLERFNPVFKSALSLVERPLFVEAFREGPFTGRGQDVSVVMDLMIHDLDLISNFVREKRRNIDGIGVSFQTDKIDFVHVFIKFERGISASLKASRVSLHRKRSMTIIEKERYLLLDFLNGKLLIKEKNGDSAYEMETKRSDPLKEELEDFISCILTGKSPSVDETVIYSLEIAEEIERHIERI